MNKKLFLVIPVLALLATLTMTSAVRAEEIEKPWHQQFVSQLAAKFGLGEAEVEGAVTEVQEQYRAERQYRMQAGFEDRLQTFVDEGKLTSGQRDAWIDKHEEMQAEREAERATHREEMQAWFAEQGIDPALIGPMGQGRGMGEGRGMGMHRVQ